MPVEKRNGDYERKKTEIKGQKLHTEWKGVSKKKYTRYIYFGLRAATTTDGLHFTNWLQMKIHPPKLNQTEYWFLLFGPSAISISFTWCFILNLTCVCLCFFCRHFFYLLAHHLATVNRHKKRDEFFFPAFFSIAFIGRRFMRIVEIEKIWTKFTWK